MQPISGWSTVEQWCKLEGKECSHRPLQCSILSVVTGSHHKTMHMCTYTNSCNSVMHAMYIQSKKRVDVCEDVHSYSLVTLSQKSPGGDWIVVVEREEVGVDRGWSTTLGVWDKELREN